ncbi:endonuclease VII domain-containing protein [Saccharopolyspora sp. WRP15-2]|uniref:Endonuclease VII domain-containing protein n=1 Tax=Saccharopolyspora oryzae TaxID=2997343 RepID=A0ABT4URD4_9PSEU|nr:endonuclease VII domain-containing protein [Saccharopolyspora oryzae]MDA3624270.1 endonuclease VII domain-containing protein [Saccharopolyspora oryzae]
MRKARARRYGLTVAEMDQLLTSQSSCGICPYVFSDDDSRFLHIDHDHVTGKVRGVLCQWCNLLLGHAREDPVILRAAASYLERHTGVVGGAA